MKREWQKKNTTAKWLLSALLLVLLAIGIMGIKSVYASLTAKEHVTNDFAMSDLSGTIDEEFTPPSKEDPMSPGKTYPKKVAITNSSDTPLFVRILVTPEIESAEGVLLSSTIGEVLTIDLGKDWLLGEDGYYYYLGKVEPKATTEPLFTKVTLSNAVDSSYDGATMAIHIKSETIIAKANHYRDAWWQSAVPTEENLKIIDVALQTLSK